MILKTLLHLSLSQIFGKYSGYVFISSQVDDKEIIINATRQAT